MKKFLIGTTALVAAGFVAGQAQAADPIKLSVGGYMNQFVGYANQDKVGGNAYAEVKPESETELYFRGSTTLDNGLTVSVNIDRYADRDDTGGDDVFMQISSDSLGRLRIGQTKGAAYALSHQAPAVAMAANDDDVSDWIRDTVVTSDQTHTASEGNDGTKIVYWTPNFAGFTAGVSYGVNVNNAGIEGVINVTSNDIDGDGTNDNGAETAWDAGIAYNGEISGVSLGADVTYQRNFMGGNKNGSATGSANEDRTAWRAGLSVGVAGFTFGGSYRDTNNENNVKDIDASAWDLGASYATGPYAVSFTYFTAEEDDGAGKQDEVNQWVLGASYDLGAGVTLVGSVFAAEFDDASLSGSENAGDNEGFGVVAGLKVAF